jgi:hypothetical protein
MNRTITLAMIIGSALTLVVLLNAGPIEAKWSRGSNIGPAAEIIHLCPDGARIGLLISDRDDDGDEPGLWQIKISTSLDHLELARQPIELQPRSVPIPEPFAGWAETHIYNYVELSLPEVAVGTMVTITAIDPFGVEKTPSTGEFRIEDCADRDDFNRQQIKLGANWQGRTSSRHYRLSNEAVTVLAGGPLYWTPERMTKPFSEQEVAVRLVKIDPHGQHRLLLKVQPNDIGRPHWRQGAIAVIYDARHHQLCIKSYIPEMGWQLGATFDFIVQENDRLAGRIIDGIVFVFVNDELIGVAPVDPFFSDKDGSLGLWFKSPNHSAVFDDFKIVALESMK